MWFLRKKGFSIKGEVFFKNSILIKKKFSKERCSLKSGFLFFFLVFFQCFFFPKGFFLKRIGVWLFFPKGLGLFLCQRSSVFCYHMFFFFFIAVVCLKGLIFFSKRFFFFKKGLIFSIEFRFFF